MTKQQRRRQHDELVGRWFRDSPESEAAYEEAKRKLDAAWEIECRYGNCTIFVSPDSSVGPDQEDGWGPVDCPCNTHAMSSLAALGRPAEEIGGVEEK